MTVPELVEDVPPTLVRGSIFRLETDGTTTWPVEWLPQRGWVTSTRVTVDEVRRANERRRPPRPVDNIPPTAIDGGLHRLVTDGEICWAEQWVNGRWIPGGALVDEICRGPTAGPETLRKFRYPTAE